MNWRFGDGVWPLGRRKPQKRVLGGRWPQTNLAVNRVARQKGSRVRVTIGSRREYHVGDGVWRSGEVLLDAMTVRFGANGDGTSRCGARRTKNRGRRGSIGRLGEQRIKKKSESGVGGRRGGQHRAVGGASRVQDDVGSIWRWTAMVCGGPGDFRDARARLVDDGGGGENTGRQRDSACWWVPSRCCPACISQHASWRLHDCTCLAPACTRQKLGRPITACENKWGHHQS